MNSERLQYPHQQGGQCKHHASLEHAHWAHKDTYKRSQAWSGARLTCVSPKMIPLVQNTHEIERVFFCSRLLHFSCCIFFGSCCPRSQLNVSNRASKFPEPITLSMAKMSFESSRLLQIVHQAAVHADCAAAQPLGRQPGSKHLLLGPEGHQNAAAASSPGLLKCSGIGRVPAAAPTGEDYWQNGMSKGCMKCLQHLP